MRPTLVTALGAVVVNSISSCASPISIEGIPVYGHLGLLPPAELRAVIAADRSAPSRPTNTIYALEVISTTEVHVHHAPWNPEMFAYDDVRKVGKKWQKPWDEHVIGGAYRTGRRLW
jgi:hypothetical protein